MSALVRSALLALPLPVRYWKRKEDVKKIWSSKELPGSSVLDDSTTKAAAAGYWRSASRTPVGSR